MTNEPRWDLIDKVPDDMQIYTGEWSSEQWTLAQWREELGHPYAQGHGHCMTCGPAMTCMLMAFFDGVVMSTIRELAKVGAFAPESSPSPLDVPHKTRSEHP